LGSVDFDPGTGIFILSAAGTNDVFISKLDSSGNFIWAKAIGGITDDYGSSIAIDDSGNIYVTGYFSSVVDFDPGAAVFNLASVGGPTGDIFILKLDSSGN